jgi:CubicO group peptidase (beta-lactamase class C family)
MMHVALVGLLLAQASDSTLIARLDSALAAEARTGFSGVVLIAHGQRVLLEKAYGRVAMGSGASLPAFWFASNTKQITAAAVLRLQEAGRLRVTDSIGRFFRDVPSDKRAITVHQLLTHTSGLPTEYRADGEADRDRAVAAILRLDLRSRPGERYAYSVDGYVLLAAIIDIASDIGFDAFMRDSLFGRAGMTHSGLWGHERPGVWIAPVADPRQTRPQPPTIYRDGRSVANWGYRGTTGAYATASDFHRWIQALRSGKILNATSLRALLGRHVLVNEDSIHQTFTGYGWGIRVENDRDVSYGHNGAEDWLGHNSVVRFAPDGVIVAVLSNSGDVNGGAWASRVNRVIRRLMDSPR